MIRRVLVTPPMLRVGDWPYRPVLDAAGLEVVFPDPALDLFDPPQLSRALVGIDAVVAGVEPFRADVLEASTLKVVARVGVGYDAVDVPTATRLGIAVTITPGTNENSVAEQAIGLIFGVFRAVARRDREVRAGLWNRDQLPRLAGRTLGLVGLGRIGRAVAWRAKGLGLNVIAADPLLTAAQAADLGIGLVSLDELLRTADIVSLHAPSIPATYRFMNAEAFAKMKPGSVLINTARGTLVDEPALFAALTHGPLWAAGLDVFDQEPPPLDHPLLSLDNVVVAPHVGGLDIESIRAMSTMAADCAAKLSLGIWPEGCVVNDELRPKA